MLYNQDSLNVVKQKKQLLAKRDTVSPYINDRIGYAYRTLKMNHQY
jgi:hypothetical protein